MLIVTGEPGIGKSALLTYAADRAAGMTMLSATGIKAESELAFSGLAELLHPILDLVDEIPKPQAAALAGALAVGPPVTSEPFAVSAATLSLLAIAADRDPRVSRSSRATTTARDSSATPRKCATSSRKNGLAK